MNRELKGALAEAVIHHVADMLDDWDDIVEREPRLSSVDRADAAKAIGQWMRRLPGYGWDDRLPAEPQLRP